MNDRQLEYMLLIAKTGSLTRAAEQLRVSQPSLSQMVKQIESALGVPIFDRTTTPLSLTYAGEKYMEAATRITAITGNLQKQVEEIHNEDYGVIRLGIPVQRSLQIVPYFLPIFHERYPHVMIDLREAGSTAMDAMVLDGEVDVACLTTSPHREELNYILVENEELVLVTGKDSPFAKRIPVGTPLKISDLKNELFISLKKGHSVRETQDRLFITYGIRPQVLMETVNIEVAKRAAVASNAVMLCPRNYLATSMDLVDRWAVYPMVGIENHRHFYICHRRDRYLPKYVRGFIELMTSPEAAERFRQDTLPTKELMYGREKPEN